MKNIQHLLFLLFSVLPLFISAQLSTDDISGTFFIKYAQNTDDAFDYLFGTNPWMANNSDGVSNVKFKVRESANLMGEYIGHELISEKTVGTSMKAAIHMVKYERQPLRFVFLFYKPKGSWMIYNFSFDEKFDEDLKSYMKLNYLGPKE